MFKQSIKPLQTVAPKTVPNPGSVSAVGPSGAAPKPRLKNTRDYGKTQPSTMPLAAPEGPPSPFTSNSHLGDI